MLVFIFFPSKPVQDGKEETAFMAHYLVISGMGIPFWNIPNPCVLGAPGLAGPFASVYQLLQDIRFPECHSTRFSSEFSLKRFASLIFKSLSLPPRKKIRSYGKAASVSLVPGAPWCHGRGRHKMSCLGSGKSE